ncbi:MAG: hypothetical protein V3V31_15920 [Methylococcales bacterium]
MTKDNLTIVKHFLLIVFLLISGVLSAASTDPLSGEESSAAIDVVVEQQPVERIARRALDDAGNGEEILLIERHISEKGSPESLKRLSDVYTYNYQTNQLVRYVVNHNSNEIESVTRTQGDQLPLTEAEIQRVIDIVFNDPEELGLLNQQYQQITGETLVSADQLEIKAFTFLAASLPGQLNEASKQCGIHRCAQLLLYTADRVVFEVSPIVDLSEKRVTQNVGF